MKLPILLKACLALFTVFLAHVAQAQVPSWARSGGGSQAELAPTTTTDSDGNVYLAGGYSSGAHIGDSVYFTNGFLNRPDFFIAKYTPDGAVEWVRHGGGENQDQVSCLRMDTDGSIYVSVSFFESFSFQNVSFTSFNSFDADLALMKLDANGQVVWARHIGGDGMDWTTEMILRPDGIYMQGQYYGTLRLDSTHQVTSAGDFDVYWTKFTLDGDPVWVRSLGGLSQDNPGGMGIDANGDIISTGTFYGTASISGTVLQPVGQQGSFLVKLTNAGSLIWAKSEATGILAMTLDPNGNIYTTGNFTGSQSFGSYPITSRGTYDGFVAKFNNNGVALWARSFGSTDVDFGYSIAYGGNGLVYTSGSYSNGARFGALPAQTSRGTMDGFVAAYTTSGDPSWVFTYGGRLQDQLINLSVDRIGNSLYATGFFVDTCRVGSQQLTSYGDVDWLLFKMDIPTATQPVLSDLAPIYPNPTAAGSSITLPFTTDDAVLIDVTGTRHPLAGSGTHTLTLPMGLAPGLYRILSEGRSVPIVVK